MLKIAVLLFDGVEELDFCGPFEVLSYVEKIVPGSVKVELVAETTDPVKAFNGMRVLPDKCIDNAKDIDIVVIPGGNGRKKAMFNEKIISWVKALYPRVKYMTSVCTGAFILAEAGLLEGKQATTHHGALEEFADRYKNVELLKERIVFQGKTVTSAGVVSGMYMAFWLVERLFGPEVAQSVKTGIEW